MATSGENNYWVLALITALAVFVRLYDLDLGSGLSLEQKTSMLLSVLVGVSSVIGLYFLVKELFDEKLAALSSFLLAVSFWHILISQLGAKNAKKLTSELAERFAGRNGGYTRIINLPPRLSDGSKMAVIELLY